MKHLLTMSAAALLLSSCDDLPSKGTEKIANSAGGQCLKDTECKGDRICDSGKCVSATLPLDEHAGKVTTNKSSSEKLKSASSEPIEICRSGTDRTMIPVWKPSVNKAGDLSSDPPQKDGLVVYIELYEEASKVECDDKKLNSFSKRINPDNAMDGGLAVNIRGNTQFANGMCYFKGYYMNQDVMGMHQGWIETYFGAVDRGKIIFSNKYCLAEPIT